MPSKPVEKPGRLEKVLGILSVGAMLCAIGDIICGFFWLAYDGQRRGNGYGLWSGFLVSWIFENQIFVVQSEFLLKPSVPPITCCLCFSSVGKTWNLPTMAFISWDYIISYYMYMDRSVLPGTKNEHSSNQCDHNLRSGPFLASLICSLMSSLAKIGPDQKSLKNSVWSAKFWPTKLVIWLAVETPEVKMPSWLRGALAKSSRLIRHKCTKKFAPFCSYNAVDGATWFYLYKWRYAIWNIS